MAGAWQGVLGLIVLTGIAWAFSENRAAVRLRVPLAGIGLQFAIALVLLRVPAVGGVFDRLNDGVLALQAATESGTTFVFGYLGGGQPPFETTTAGSTMIFAFTALPLVIVVSALTALLTYWRILPAIVRAFSYVFRKAFGVGGPVALSAAANIFVGMIEAPLLVRGYLSRLGRGELFMVMACGMATIAGTVLVLYITIVGPTLPDAAGHLITASIISAPAAIMLAWLMVPPSGQGTAGDALEMPGTVTGSMDAITQGPERGLALYLNIVAMLVVLVALVSLANILLGAVTPEIGGEPVTLERVLGWVMAPLVWLIGVPWADAQAAGSLMGIKTVLNEFLAYEALAEIAGAELEPRSVLIMSYALCGMANFGSVGIMIGGFTALVPDRRREVAGLGLKSLVAGTLATLMTGAVVGIVA